MYICDECIGLCGQILDDEAHAAGEASYHAGALLNTVAQLGPRAPYARARPALRAAIELGRRHRDVLREAMVLAVALDDLDTAAAAVRAIAPADRTPMDAIDLGGILVDLGHADDALAALATVDGAALGGLEAILHPLHEVQARLARGGLDAAAVAALRGRITELGPATAALPAGALEDALRARRLAVMGLAALAVSAHDAAEQAGRAHLAARPASPVAHELLARVLAARGDDTGARELRAAGLALAHPESLFAARLAPTPAPPPFR